MKFYIFSLFAIAIQSISVQSKPTKITFVGDSIVRGWPRETNSIPAYLKQMLNDDTNYKIENLGEGGYCVSKSGDKSYWDLASF